MPKTHHPKFDFAYWSQVFPIGTFEDRERPRTFPTTDSDDPLDLWKAWGDVVSSPAHLCELELVRKRVAEKHDLGEPIPVDMFVWKSGEPDKSYLTKLGGIPHREASDPWPISKYGKPFTFISQFCFCDSLDVVPCDLPGEIMLVFFHDHESYLGGPGPSDIHIEWSRRDLTNAATIFDCPKPQFPSPQFSGVIHRSCEYPDSRDAFEQEGHYRYWRFASSQSTKIGRETYYIQHDPRVGDEELLCTLNSFHPHSQWPLVDLERLPENLESSEFYGWGKFKMMFADLGCIYFLINSNGDVRVAFDC